MGYGGANGAVGEKVINAALPENISVMEMTKLYPCTSVSLAAGGSGFRVGDSDGKCVYENGTQLRYVYMY